MLWGLLPVTAVTLFVLLVFEKPPRDFWPWVFLAGMALLPFGQVYSVAQCTPQAVALPQAPTRYRF